jgi:hypothetical protein
MTILIPIYNCYTCAFGVVQALLFGSRTGRQIIQSLARLESHIIWSLWSSKILPPFIICNIMGYYVKLYSIDVI